MLANSSARRRGRRGVRLVTLPLVAVLALVAGLMSVTLSATPARAAALVEVFNFGSNPGNLRMFKYVPDGLPANAPVVVALHGGGQTATEYEGHSGWTKYADLWKFAVVFPEQKPENNSGRGFNWFLSSDNQRGAGEPLSIKQMVDKIGADHQTNPARVFVTGLSAGGGMTTVMMATYPDVFAGGAVVAGTPYGCANTTAEGFTCTFNPPNWTPQQWGDKVRNAFPGWSGPWPKLTVWHGTQDEVANPRNAGELVKQWTNVHGIDQTVDAEDTVRGYPHRHYKDGTGVTKVDHYVLTGVSHGQPIDPGSALEQCGTTGNYFLDVNICAAFHSAQFWGLEGSSDPPPPGSETATFSSGAEDGYVKALSDGSAAEVGTNKATLGLGIGRGIDGKFNRTILSFDTSPLPDGTTVNRAYITVTRNSSSGDPWANPAGNQLMIDVKSGCFGTTCNVETADWSAAPTQASVANIAKWTSGSTNSTNFNQAGLSAINKSGLTQLKLRFSLFQTSTAYVIIGHGANAILTVEYTVP